MTDLLNGIVFGLGISISVGPVFFTMVQASIERGVSYGISLGAGAWTGDLILLLLSYWGLSSVLFSDEYLLYFGIIGSLILFFIGGHSLLTKPATIENTTIITAYSFGGYYLKGFLIDFFNPVVVLLWMSITFYQVHDQELSTQQATYFYVGILGTIIGVDILKVFLARKVCQFLTPNLLLWLRRIFGLLLIILSIALFYKSLII